MVCMCVLNDDDGLEDDDGDGEEDARHERRDEGRGGVGDGW